MLDEPPEPLEVQLLRSTAQCDHQAFGQLYDRFSAVVLSFALRILNDVKEAEDVVQEVFVQIWNNAKSYDPAIGKPLNWILTLTRNKAIDRLRAAERRSRIIDDANDEATGTIAANDNSRDVVVHAENARLIRSAMANLPGDQREAIEMAFFRGMTQSEIAADLKQPLGTVKARIRRGMLKLRESLEQQL